MKITYGPKINYRLCNGCAKCYDNCPMDVFGWDDDRGQPTVVYPGECSHCVICELGCPEQAITVELPTHAKLFLGLHP